MTTTTERPAGVTGLAVLALIAGGLHVLAGLGDIGIAGGFLSDHGFGNGIDGVMNIVGVVLVVVGIVGVATGIGLWSGRSWAWLITRLWASVAIVAGLVGAGLSFFGDTLTSTVLATVVGSAVPAILAAIVLWYLYRPEVRTALGRR